jgi:hypothetical protein
MTSLNSGVILRLMLVNGLWDIVLIVYFVENILNVYHKGFSCFGNGATLA